MKILLRVSLLSLCAFLAVACTSGDQLRKVEQELGDLKVEVFKLRQQQEEDARKAGGEQQAAAQARAQDRRFQADLQESVRQLQDTVRIINNKVGATPRQSAAASAPPSAPSQSSGSDEDKAFQIAVVDYNRGGYALAAEGFQLFAKTYPSSAKRSEALFYLGLCQYNQRAYDKAQPVFEQILREYAGSSQFLPAKLKRAQCLLKQGFKPAAAKAFKELVDGFQGTPEARTAQQELSDMGL